MDDAHDVTSEERYELKLVVDGGMVEQARSWIHLHPEAFREAYPTRIVNSLYLDTAELSNFNANLAGISERRKLRLRWYGTENGEAKAAVLELKIKNGQLGDKRRWVLPEPLNLDQPYAAILRLLRRDAPDFWQPWLQQNTQPTLINRYRRAYYATPDGEMRLTLDDNQAFFDQRLSGRPDVRRKLQAGDTAVIELKASPLHEQRLEQAMGYFPLLRSRNSKYILGLLQGTL
jgi:hypothetical protein